MGKKISINARIKSFKYAFNGVKLFLCNEHNAWIHLTAAVMVIIGAWFFKFSEIEWLILILTIGFVLTTEAINTAIEYLCNHVCKEHNNEIGIIKDVAAGAVLLSAITAAIIGIILFTPKIIDFITTVLHES